MTLTSEHRREFEELLDLFVAESISNSECDRLNELMRNCQSAQLIYIENLNMHAALAIHARAQPSATMLLQLLGSAPAEGFCKEVHDRPTSLINQATSSDELSDHRVPVLGFLGGVNQLISRPVLWSIFGVALLVYGTFTIISWNLRSGALPNDSARSQTVATIVEMENVKWDSPKSALRNLNSEISSGEPLTIAAGIVEIRLKSGTTLNVVGPAEWCIDGDNHVTLEHGKLLAIVPHQAIGFALETATTRIIDLGTEFTVEAQQHGATEVEVLAGKVELRLAEKQKPSPPASAPITLTAGAARRIESEEKSGGLVVREVPAKSQRLARKTHLIQSNRILGVAAMASSTEIAEFGANNLVNGSGMHGDRHSNKTTDTMWSSTLGKVVGEFVLFDLARRCKIEAMKVWNYNETAFDLFRVRGVKQADIYISNTGDGDPISRPEAWQLVVDDCKFSLADGTPDYDTPDVIPLGDVESRFVAMVFEETFGADPRPELNGVRSVALSEVQFFGQRLQAEDDRKSKQ